MMIFINCSLSKNTSCTGRIALFRESYKRKIVLFREKEPKSFYRAVAIVRRANTPRIILNYCAKFDWRAQQTHLAVLQPHFASKNGGLPIAVKTTHNDFLSCRKSVICYIVSGIIAFVCSIAVLKS